MVDAAFLPIGLASDHAGYELKEWVRALLNKKAIPSIDYGTHTADSVSYARYGHLLAQALKNGEVSRGIAVCGSGNGISMTLNKYPHIRAALCWNNEIAELARKHNNANVLVLPGRFLPKDSAEAMVDIFLNTPFEGGRHQARIDAIPIPATPR